MDALERVAEPRKTRARNSEPARPRALPSPTLSYPPNYDSKYDSNHHSTTIQFAEPFLPSRNAYLD